MGSRWDTFLRGVGEATGRSASQAQALLTEDPEGVLSVARSLGLDIPPEVDRFLTGGAPSPSGGAPAASPAPAGAGVSPALLAGGVFLAGLLVALVARGRSR